MRYKTFDNWPISHLISPMTMVEAGFIYTGDDDKVQCFVCGGYLYNWIDVCPLDEHLSGFPECRFAQIKLNQPELLMDIWDEPAVMAMKDQNYPDHIIERAFKDLNTQGIACPNGEQLMSRVLEIAPDSCIDQENEEEDIYGCPDPVTTPGNTPSTVAKLAQTECIQIDIKLKYEELKNKALVMQENNERSEFLSLTHGPSNPLDSQALFTSLPPNQPDCVSYSKSEEQRGLLQSTPKRHTCYGKMSHEDQRLKSFFNWPPNSPVTPIDLARAGLYYSGVRDEVRCAFCGLVLFGWEEGDHPMKEHERLGPACRFVGLQKTTDVVHASGQVLTLGAQLNDSQTGMRNCQPNVGIGTECVKYPYYALESHRLKTFDKWPFFVEQQPEALAKAGFYSVRVSDRVKCFFCDGGLRNWEYGDEPWTVHARWFPNCGFLLKIQGETFVQQVQNRYNPGVTAIAAPTSGVRTAINQPGEASAGPNPPMAFNDVENMAIEMGFGKENVRRVMKHKIFTAGTFSDFEALLAVLLVTNSNEDTSREPNKHIGKEEHVKVNKAAAPENSDTEENDEKPPAKSKNQRKKQRRKQNKVAAIAESASKLTDRPGGLSQPEHGERARDDNMQSMIEENEQLKDQRVCKVCMDNEVSMVFLPCGHLVCCSICAQELRLCPICRGLIRGTVRTYAP